MKQVLITICSVICLCITFLSSGIVLCMSVPQITQNLSGATALVESAHFTRDQLVFMADKTRAFVAGEIDKNEIYNSIQKLNVDANTEYSKHEGSDFAAVPDEFSLDQNSLDHLDDVRSLFANIRIALGICGFGALIFCLLLLILCGRSSLGRALEWSGLLVIALIVVFSVWAVVDFNGMFNWLHSLFFTNGSWFFGDKSLLISMYPISFWIGMALICIITSAALSVVSIFLGKFIK